MKDKALRCIESVRTMCPYLAKQGQITAQLVETMAPKCPFMRSTHLVKPGDKASLEEIGQRLSDPLNFVDLDAFGKKQQDLKQCFKDALKRLHDEGRYRVFINILRQVGEFPKAIEYHTPENKKVTVWCSNDYLGMGQHPKVISAMKRAIDAHGAGSGGTRNIGGNTDLHVQLERELADLHNKEAALVCTSGYVANEAALSTLPSIFPDGAIYFSDHENHASMIFGMRHAKLPKKDLRVFRHNDMAHLEGLLKESAENPEDAKKARIIVFESVYSMSGTIAPMETIRSLADRYNALTFIDEVHAVGLYGERGAGVGEERGIEFDIISGTLGKAFGVHGGYISASSDIIDCIRSFAPGFIFTTSIPPATLAGSIASIQYLKKNDRERKLLHYHSRYMKQKLREAGLPVLPSESHIVPLFIGNPHKCKQVSDTLLREHGIYVQPINYPTVPRGEELLRLCPGPFHTPQLIDEFVASASEVWRTLGLASYDDLQTFLSKKQKA